LRQEPAGPEPARVKLSRVERTTLLWVFVVFFGASIVFGGLRRLTEDSSAAVTAAVQVGALALLIGLAVFAVRRMR